jgi:hypothetical protein
MAGIRDISIYKGDSYTHEVRIKNSANTAINISGRTYRAQIRKTKSSETIIQTFTTTISNAAAGTLNITLSSGTTSNINTGIYYYDLEETNGSTVTTLMGGKITVIGEVSRG